MRDIAGLGAAMVGHIRRTTPADQQGEAALDALDLVAVRVGDKQIAVLGCGGGRTPWLDGIEALLAGFDLVSARGPMWRVTAETDGLPDWYAGAIAAARRGTDVLRVGRADAEAQHGDAIDAETEAARLGYPVCCVNAYHRRRRRYHDFTMAAIQHFAGPDEQRMRRFAAAEVVLQPVTHEHRTQLQEALRCAMAPLTSVCMCPPCRRDADGPAMRLSRRRQLLARSAGLDNLLALVPA